MEHPVHTVRRHLTLPNPSNLSSQVRWQHEDDVAACQNCKSSLSANRRKHHCRHCGRIFCSDCVTKTVASGPTGRPAKVCDVCHTLLVQNSAPYFSTEAPHN